MDAPAAQLACELRRDGLIIELGDENFRLKKSLETADKLGARFVVIVGENEVQSQQFALKDLRAKAQTTIPRAELAPKIKAPCLSLSGTTEVVP
jgi:histidyl-tRNA synthetase